jgi:multiple sugar transport system permease protein
MLLLLPAVLVLAAVVIVPLLLSFYSSFTPFRLTKPDTFWIFYGFRNYARLLNDLEFWIAFGRTVLLLTIALNLEMLFGLGLAMLVEKALNGQRVLRTIMMFPMMFSPLLVGFQFKFMFNDNVGVINNALQALGLTENAIPWLIDGKLAFAAILVAEIWSSTSVFAILILAGLLAMPKEPIEAARVDGCTPWQTFRYVTWPFVMPFAFIAMTIRSLDVARAYDIVKIMTDGGPAGRTELLWTMVARKIGRASCRERVS